VLLNGNACMRSLMLSYARLALTRMISNPL
jgi:hypothetical protein